MDDVRAARRGKVDMRRSLLGWPEVAHKDRQTEVQGDVVARVLERMRGCVVGSGFRALRRSWLDGCSMKGARAAKKGES